MSLSFRLIVFGLGLWLIDLYFYRAVTVIMKNSPEVKRNLIFYIYWGFTVFSFITLITTLFYPYPLWPKFFRIYVFAFVILIMICKLIGIPFLLIDDFIRLVRWIGSFFKSDLIAAATTEPIGKHTISRLKFLSYLTLGMAGIPFASFIYGMIKTAFDFQIRREQIRLSGLPNEFNGLKIVQISDIHSGSFVSAKPLEDAVRLIMNENPDVIFFTGDLINDRADEMYPFREVLNKLSAPMGVFSILGNHDYGDYTRWESQEAKAANIEELKQIQREMRWDLLLNEHRVLKRGESEIALIGVENWGAKMNFPKYGDLQRAAVGTEKYPVSILLSHDPSHWDAQVNKDFKHIGLTLSGHTHGFQFGVETKHFRWSPSQYIYKEWAGLYQKDNQQIYVNRGLGFIGYPGRVGIRPEITVLELYNA